MDAHKPFTQGTRVTVKNMCYSLTENPFLPNFVGKTGVVQSECYGMYLVRLDQPFRVGIIPKTVTQLTDYVPEQWQEIN
jgi:hypothetical protein